MLQATTGLDWSEMLFFDDESGNVHKVSCCEPALNVE